MNNMGKEHLYVLPCQADFAMKTQKLDMYINSYWLLYVTSHSSVHHKGLLGILWKMLSVVKFCNWMA